MVIDFPSFPLDGELHTVNGIVYRYSSAIGAWLINADGVTNTLLVANTLTVNTSVIVGSINVEPTIIGAYDQANTARDHANAAFAQANTGGGGGGITYVRKTSNYTANTNEGVIADTSAGSFTVTLPASPNVGSQVIVVDGDNWAANTLTVSRNGLTIEGLSENLILDIAGAAVTFIYDGATWETYAQIGISTAGLAVAYVAYDHANAAFAQANTARNHANVSFDQANSAYIQANVAVDTALAFAIALG